MNIKRAAVVTTVSIATLLGGYVALNAARPYMVSYAAEALAEPAHFRGHRQGGWQGRSGHGIAMVCSDRRDRRIGNVVDLIESFVDFTAEQTEAWNNLTQAVRDSSAAVGTACEGVVDAEMPRTAPERIARLELMLTVGLEVVGRVRPAFDSFYAVLTDEQKKTVDALISRRHKI